jgi:hypothetical protein
MADLMPPVGDFLGEMLLRGDAPTLDMVLTLSPDEPLTALRPYEGVPPAGAQVIETRLGTFIMVPHEWTTRQRKLKERCRGLQLDYWAREARKYFEPYGETLSGWVRELLNTAKMHHSLAVVTYYNGYPKNIGLTTYCTNLQFRDWLPGYLEEVGWYVGARREVRWDEAGQIARIACGLPRFAPTKPRKAGR